MRNLMLYIHEMCSMHTENGSFCMEIDSINRSIDRTNDQIFHPHEKIERTNEFRTGEN